MYNKNFSKEPTEKQKLGSLGEDFACKYLESIGYKVVERNYLKKWGEIDIVAKKGNKIHFVEVKAVSRDLPAGEAGILEGNVTHVTSDGYRAEDNMHFGKLQRLGRAIQSYLLDRDVPESVDWQFDVVTVHVDTKRNTHRVFLLPDIVL